MFAYKIHRIFKHYDWKSSYEVIRNLKLIHTLVLDVGCGDGSKSIIHKDYIKVLIGLDINLKCLINANMKGIYVVQGEAIKLPFKNGSFDLVMSFHVIEHIKNDLMFINEIYRVLKETGYAILITPNRIRSNTIIYKFLTRSKEMYPMNPEHVYEYTKEDFETLLFKSYFKHYKVRPIGFIRLPILEIATIPHFFSKHCDQLMAILRK